MNGKSKCRLLKDIRRKIAQENDITYVTSECKFQGNCKGTCPKCEAEVRYLEEELKKRKNAGKTVAVAGVAAAMLVAGAGCDSAQPDKPESTKATTEINEVLAGVVPYEDTSERDLEGRVPEETWIEMGEVPYEDTTQPPTGEIDLILTGDVAWP